MEHVVELHPHSKYSRACSPQLTIKNIDATCARKGVSVMGTGDFTHPAWFAEMKKTLVPAETGLYAVRDSKNGVRFICTSEIACIYSKGGKVRRLHIVIVAPGLEAVEKINKELFKIGNLAADGRPILGLDAKKLAEIVWSIDEKCLVIPAHAWTPWFSVFGSFSGFDSLKECFEELTPRIYAIETGLSSDPEMNWRLSVLDSVLLVSNSDAHSLPNIAREANRFEIAPEKLSYAEIHRIIKEKDRKGFLGTIEFYPEEGMYHYDGHRACQKSFAPAETKRLGGKCPSCGKPLTIGVLSRVEQLADRPEGFKPASAFPYVKLVELDKIIADALGIKTRHSKVVQEEYDALVAKGKTELNILLALPLSELKGMTSPEIAEGIKRVREGKLKITPGYDGQYGKVEIFGAGEAGVRQAAMF
ncbi:MAG: endonuclease Q family protein [Patescibacteria group bacterium]|nr:endonuclease Q family protein [Patescibacteria group bacterium]